MLVLARKKGESIMIGEDIEITVIGIEGDTVRIGIAAPKQVQVYRQEIYKAIRESNQEALQNHLNLDSLSGIFRKRDKNGE